MQNRILTKSPVLTALISALLGTSLISCGGTSTSPPPGRPAAPLESASTEFSSAYGSPVVAGRIETDDVEESSGLSASECQDVLWTHNDAGNEALIFGMSTEGKHLGTWQVENASNIDWESIATYQDPGGKCFLIIGDIGDNDEARGELDIYRIPEPTASTETAPSNRENPLRTELVVGEKVADISVPSDPEGRLTGGSISPDGRRVMLCDLKGGYELTLPEGATDLDAIWQQRPLAVDLGDRPQGEGVSYGRDGISLFASSEEKNSPLFLIKRK